MIQTIDFQIEALKDMKKYPKLFYLGNLALLNSKKISVVGSRKPNQYARSLTQELCSKLSAHGVTIVSGGAIGIDAIAHKSAGAEHTIMVAGTGLDTRYPAINKALISDIEQKGLVLSQFESGTTSKKYNFPLRNELIVALGEILVVAYGDLNSGTSRSVEYAQKMGKEIYVFPHRIGESEGTNKLLQDGIAKAIYDIDSFVSMFEEESQNRIEADEFLLFCRKNPNYEDVIRYDAQKLFAYELQGKVEVKNLKVYVL
ncbi:DNA-processing protein DprA [Sulfurimonas sp. C5]|uniref:DNA-processing protein DprA n=1 Tax=Sulfurimonas sp. C5 TaxID=3036947 RepID=UPI0024554176|nr:DNA-processing protein DprA [Sulfurimonas sp. C5]MDH4945037.1 DNA-protecting protein DprA [Sulfurimonas sp. C5]